MYLSAVYLAVFSLLVYSLLDRRYCTSLLRYWYASCFCDPPPGHRMPLGHQCAPSEPPVDVLLEWPTPTDFFSQYVRPLRPVLFAGLAREQPAFRLWTDRYLSEKFGNITVQVETRKKEDRREEGGSLTISEFVSTYLNSQLYVVDVVHEQMRDDLLLPSCLECRELTDVLVDVLLWFSGGGTSSVLHADAMDNINCLLEGTKQIYLVDQKYFDRVPLDHIDGLYSSVDVDDVDLFWYTGLENLPWYNVTMEAGDCLYIPHRWPHQVTSSQTRNLAFNVWFVHRHHINTTLCRHQTTSLPLSLAHIDLPESELIDQADVVAIMGDRLTLTDLGFADLYTELTAADAVNSVFHQLDADGDQLLTAAEMFACDPARFKRLFPRFEPISAEY